MNDQDKNDEAPENPEVPENPAEAQAAADAAAAAATDETLEPAPEWPDGEDGAPDAGTETDDASDADETADLKDKLLRALADMENLRRRSQKDLEDARKYTAANFARDMLSVSDNLRRAIDSIPEDGDPDGAALVAFIEGISLTEKELQSTLERHGIQKIDPAGEKFDPQFHEAMFEVPTPEAANGTIVQVVEVGYVIHDRLLRPAKVGIAKSADGGPAGPADPGDQVDTTA